MEQLEVKIIFQESLEEGKESKILVGDKVLYSIGSSLDEENWSLDDVAQLLRKVLHSKVQSTILNELNLMADRLKQLKAENQEDATTEETISEDEL